jgi:hypothetical protein
MQTLTYFVGRSKYRYSLIAVLLLAIAAKMLFAEAAAYPAAKIPEETTPTALEDPSLVIRYQQMMRAEDLAARLYFLASDLFEGRETATRGQRLAAHYLASQYRRLGLLPKGTVKTTDPLDPAAYFQRFKVHKRLAVREARLEVISGGKTLETSIFSPEAQDEMAFFSYGTATNASGGVVFAGYGIGDSTLGYDDFAALAQKGIKLDGKWIIILADEPLKEFDLSLLPTADQRPSKWTAQPLNKRQAIWEHGRPAGVLVVSDASPRARLSFKESAARAVSLTRGVGPVSIYQSTPSSFPPQFNISTRMADKILSASGQTVKGLTEEIGRTLKPVVFEVKETEVKAAFKPFEPLETENVLAFIEGSDPKLKDEVVIISAHYDHLGINPQGNLSDDEDQIFNGAADDGSGTVATLEIAAAFMQAKRDGVGPRRSILFINFSGEEKGLLGSTYYTDIEPVVPLEKTVANINMDGIGGFDLNHPTRSKNYIYIVGSKEVSQEMMETNERLNRTTGINLQLDYQPYFASDQFNFQKLFIPFIYYSTGLTEHYHEPGDEPATIDYKHMARVAQLVFANAWQTANQAAAPKGVDRSQLVLMGYGCRPCSLSCDNMLFERPGECPVCGMILAPRYKLKS